MKKYVIIMVLLCVSIVINAQTYDEIIAQAKIGNSGEPGGVTIESIQVVSSNEGKQHEITVFETAPESAIALPQNQLAYMQVQGYNDQGQLTILSPFPIQYVNLPEAIYQSFDFLEVSIWGEYNTSTKELSNQIRNTGWIKTNFKTIAGLEKEEKLEVSTLPQTIFNDNSDNIFAGSQTTFNDNLDSTFTVSAEGECQYTPEDKIQLREIIRQELSTNGDEANLNNICTTYVVDMSGLFQEFKQFNGDISEWDVSRVIDMSKMFQGVSAFRGNIENWNVRNVKDMSQMFEDSISFTGNINAWDVGKVIDMSRMFMGASLFNTNIGGWDVSNVKFMNEMFTNASIFDQDLEKWNVKKVKDMDQMFNLSGLMGNEPSWYLKNKNAHVVSTVGATKLTPNNKAELIQIIREEMKNQKDYKTPNLNNIDTSRIEDMSYLFANIKILESENISPLVKKTDFVFLTSEEAKAFNGDISQWNVVNVSTMEGMFIEATSFNSDISRWDVANVKTMEGMFAGARAFNRNISEWNVRNVQNMGWMFRYAFAFNQDINKWNVSKVKNMYRMFEGAKAFNKDISNWDVSRVKLMEAMFLYAISFRQNINDWDVSKKTNVAFMFVFSGLMETEPRWYKNRRNNYE